MFEIVLGILFIIFMCSEMTLGEFLLSLLKSIPTFLFFFSMFFIIFSFIIDEATILCGLCMVYLFFYLIIKEHGKKFKF
jgi:predicted membrane protein